VSGRRHYRDISWTLFSAHDARCVEQWGERGPDFQIAFWATDIGAPVLNNALGSPACLLGPSRQRFPPKRLAKASASSGLVLHRFLA
jgi:hypothetical protein